MPIMIVLLTLIALKYSPLIKRHFKWIFLGSLGLAGLAYVSQNLSIPINSGELGMALFIVVMFQSAFKKGTLVHKKLLSVRKEYSILGFIMVLPHGLIYLVGDYQTIEWQGLVALLVMVPLFITSFIGIRKRMNNKHWKLLHMAAYPAYILMFAHVIFVGETQSRWMYGGIALVYIVLKVKNHGFQKLKNQGLGTSMALFLLAVIAFNFYSLRANVTYIDTTSVSFEDGVYRGEASGFKSMPLLVDVTISAGDITRIDVIQYGASASHHGVDFKAAVDQVKAEILADQTMTVDTISGATISTTALKEAVNQALRQAASQ